MNIARYAIEKPVNTWLLIMFCFFGGIAGYFMVGKLEDPAFTIKQAVIITYYNGATAEEVEKEVTEVLETAIQQMAQVDKITSTSTAGISEIKVEIKSTYNSSKMPQTWDELRRKVNDAQMLLPQGTSRSMVNDDFGDVFGIFYAVTAPDFSDSQKIEIAKFLRRELLTVKNVAKVTTSGEPTENIYIEIANERLVSLGIPIDSVIGVIQNENAVASSGSIRIDDKLIRLTIPTSFDYIDDIKALRIGISGTTKQVKLSDIANIFRASTEIQNHMIRFNGEEAFTIGVSGVSDANIVDIGKAVDAKLQELSYDIPLGVNLYPIYEQHKVVNQAMNDFIVNLLMSVSIVIGVLCLFMGWRMGVVVGSTLFLTVTGTLFFMGIFGIDMQRISLGALIVAMGMLGDNAIVIAECMLINIQKGMKTKEAADEATKRTQIPLLGATVIGIMAFAGIGLSKDVTGEFLFTLFAVVAISLLLSWLLSITVAPLFGCYLLKNVKEENNDPYDGIIYYYYHQFLQKALHYRKATVFALIGITLICFYGFSFVKQSFFPDSNTPMFYIDYMLPQGTDIRATARDIAEIEKIIIKEQGVVSVASFIGRGASRFILTYSPESANPAYGQFIVTMENRNQIDALAKKLRKELGDLYPNAEIRTKRMVFGPGDGAKIEARFLGDNPTELRELANKAIEIMKNSGELMDIRHDWRQKEIFVSPVIDKDRARLSGITRKDIAQTLLFSTTGITIDAYRDNDRMIPITVRPPDEERLNINRLNDRFVWSYNGGGYVPIQNVVSKFEPVSEEVLIKRRNRVRALTVQAESKEGLTATEGLNAVKNQIERLNLPEQYKLEWGGEYESSGDAQKALGSSLPLTFVMMLTISILLFGKIKQPLIIWSVVPMAICGVAIGLLTTGFPFSFTALLGLLSLSGMLMKNAIVLVDEIDQQIAEGREPMQGIIYASVSRIRPVFLAAGTTILGMIPLISDAFFASMAVTIMGGLTFATILTLIAVPVIYALFFGIKFSNSRK